MAILSISKALQKPSQVFFEAFLNHYVFVCLFVCLFVVFLALTLLRHIDCFLFCFLQFCQHEQKYFNEIQSKALLVCFELVIYAFTVNLPFAVA